MSKTNLEYLIDSKNWIGDKFCDELCDLNSDYSKCIKCKNDQSCYECYVRNLKWLLEEHKEPILTDAEKEYLAGVIRPFRSKVKYIVKIEIDGCGKQYVFISLQDNDNISLPHFKANTMYTGMDIWHNYTLEELGL